MVDTRAQFILLLENQRRLAQHWTALCAQAAAWQNRADAERKRNKKRKASSQVANPPTQEAVFVDLSAALIAEGQDLRAQAEQYKVLEAANGCDLLDCARSLRPQAGSHCLILAIPYGRYNQTNDATYQRAEAELAADRARLHGLEADVVQMCSWSPDLHTLYLNGRSAKGDFAAVVYVQDAVDIEIVRRLPHPPLVEQVRMCWKRGVNPRVLIQGLPYDFEEKHGLDYFGNSKPEAAA